MGNVICTVQRDLAYRNDASSGCALKRLVMFNPCHTGTYEAEFSMRVCARLWFAFVVVGAACIDDLHSLGLGTDPCRPGQF